MIIFDCDGVLVDSEILSNRIDAELLTAAGWPVSAETMIRRFIGRPKPEIWALIEAERGAPFPPGLLQQSEALLKARLQTELQPVQGVAAALDRIGGPACVASSSAMDKLRLSLQVTGLLERFDPHVFSASQVARGKPAPDVFLFAARRMGVAPQDCLVIEDSPAGVQAARAAGMTVLGFTGGRHSYPGHPERLLQAGADDAVPDMAALPDRLAARGRPTSRP